MGYRIVNATCCCVTPCTCCSNGTTPASINIKFNSVAEYATPRCGDCADWNNAAGFDVPMVGCTGQLDTGICPEVDESILAVQMICPGDTVTFQTFTDADTIYRLTVAGKPLDCSVPRTLNRLSAFGLKCMWNGATALWTPN